MHAVVGVIRRHVARRALPFAEEYVLPLQFALAGFERIESAEQVEPGCRRKIQQRLKLCHEMHLAAAFQNVGAFARCIGRDAVKIGTALFELGEVLHRLHRTLRPEQALYVQSSQ